MFYLHNCSSMARMPHNPHVITFFCRYAHSQMVIGPAPVTSDSDPCDLDLEIDKMDV